MSLKVAVIGSGMAGMASAIRLSNLGHAVEVFEASPSFGGKLTSFRLNAYRFDAGPSLFTLPKLTEELLRLGYSSAPDFQYQRLNPVCNYRFANGLRFEANANPENFIDEFSRQFEVSPSKLRKYLHFYRKTYRIIAPVFLEQSLHLPASYFNKITLKGMLNLWRLKMGRSMNKIQQQHFSNPKAVQYFNRYATYNGSNPYTAPATLNVISQLELFDGAYLPSGGMHDISNALYQKALNSGVKFHFNCPVSKIILHKNKVTGLTDQGGNTYSFDAVFSNADVKKTYKNLLNTEPPAKIRKAENSSSALIFYWGIKKSFPELDLHNILFSEDYREEFNNLFKHHSIGDDPTVYINITSKFVKYDAPEGCENWFVMINAPANYGQNWEMLRLKARAAVVKKINNLLNTDIEPLIEEEDFLDPVRIEARTGSDRGSLYGTSSNNMNSAFMRHANFSSAIKGLYFCGGSVHPGGGIPLTLLSARIATEIFEKRQGKR